MFYVIYLCVVSLTVYNLIKDLPNFKMLTYTTSNMICNLTSRFNYSNLTNYVNYSKYLDNTSDNYDFELDI